MLSRLLSRPKILLLLATLGLAGFVAAEYEDLLPYTGIAVGLTGPSQAPFFGQGIIGHVSFGPLTPLCYVNGTVLMIPRLMLPSGVITGHGLTLKVPISWKLTSCGAEGDFQVTLRPAGVYHFTLSNCTTIACIGCANLPATVYVLPFQYTTIYIYADTGIR